MKQRDHIRDRRAMHRFEPVALALLLTACGQQAEQPPVERVALKDVRATVALSAMESPVTDRAIWTVAENGHAIHFANAEEKPLLTLDCRLDADPVQLAIIRHAPALPGQGALLAVMGNGHASRLLADATLQDGEWRWESTLPAADPQLDLFIGPGDMRATLPGKGALEMPPSRIPGEFVEWCRAGGETVNAPVVREQVERDEPSAAAPAQ